MVAKKIQGLTTVCGASLGLADWKVRERFDHLASTVAEDVNAPYPYRGFRIPWVEQVEDPRQAVELREEP